MASLGPWSWRAAERHQNKPVDVPVPRFTVLGQPDYVVAGIYPLRLEHSAFELPPAGSLLVDDYPVKAADSAVITDFVVAFESWDGKPPFVLVIHEFFFT